jgi:hypothetical protein
MKLKTEILTLVNNPQSRNRIAQALEVGEQAVAVQMRVNAINGRLTKMDALQAISKECGVPVENILETEEAINVDSAAK